MRWELDGPNLSVMPDSPYLRVYKVDYVNMARDTAGTVGVSSQVGSTVRRQQVAAAAAAARTLPAPRSSSTSNNHFWDTLVDNLQSLLHETDKIFPATGGAGGSARRARPRPAQRQPAAGPGATAAAPGAPAAAPGADVPRGGVGHCQPRNRRDHGARHGAPA